MGLTWFRVAVAVGFVVAWCSPFYVDAVTIGDGVDDEGADDLVLAAYLAFFVVLTLATGFIVRSPALVLPIIIFFALTPLGANPEDSDGWSYAGLYVIPLGFLSFFVLLLGWMARLAVDFWQRRRASGASTSQQTDDDDADGEPSVVALLALTVPACLLAAVVFFLASTSDVKAPKVNFEDINTTRPQAGDTELDLTAEDVESCSSEDDGVDLDVEETTSEVVIDASLEVNREFPCESGPADVPFIVTLERPLGERPVVDISRGVRRVIWSTEVRTGLERRERLTAEDAQRFLLSKRSGSDAKCRRANDRYFYCSYLRAGNSARSDVILTVLPTGEFALGPK